MAFSDRILFAKLSFSPYEVKNSGQWYRAFSHAFIHADFTHLAMNMFVLWQFGEVLEKEFGYHFHEKGTLYFSVLYLGGILFATIISYSRHQNNPSYHSVGASGAVSAVVFSCIIMKPDMNLALFLFPIPIPGFIFGLLYMTAEIILDKRAKFNIAHDAHIMGALFGIIFTCLLDIEILKNFIHYIKTYFGG
jgi:membrane associated rhomboid family serine protease